MTDDPTRAPTRPSSQPVDDTGCLVDGSIKCDGCTKDCNHITEDGAWAMMFEAKGGMPALYVWLCEECAELDAEIELLDDQTGPTEVH